MEKVLCEPQADIFDGFELSTPEGICYVREHALRLARENPQLAAEVGIGRPDLPGAYDWGLPQHVVFLQD